MIIILVITIFSLTASFPHAFERGLIKMESWKERRDKGVVKQDKDYSCGASALATLLQMYGASVTEKEILKETAQEGRLSFEDIHKSAMKRGHRAWGFAGSLDTLRRLKYPVIVFLRPEKGEEHFSVLYKIDDKRVYLADPSWGRARMEISRFERLWRTKEGELYGRFLVILPKEGSEYKAWETPNPFYGNIIAVKDFMPF